MCFWGNLTTSPAADHVSEVLAATVAAADRALFVVDTDQLTDLVVMLAEQRHERLPLLGGIEFVHDQPGREVRAGQFQLAVDGQHFQLEHTDILVDLYRFTIPAFARFGGLIP